MPNTGTVDAQLLEGRNRGQLVAVQFNKGTRVDDGEKQSSGLYPHALDLQQTKPASEP